MLGLSAFVVAWFWIKAGGGRLVIPLGFVVEGFGLLFHCILVLVPIFIFIFVFMFMFMFIAFGVSKCEVLAEISTSGREGGVRIKTPLEKGLGGGAIDVFDGRDGH